MYGWGSNGYGQLGLGNSKVGISIDKPEEILSLNNINLSLFSTNISMYEWNTKNHNQFFKQTKEEIFTILLLSLFNKETNEPIHLQSLFYKIPRDTKPKQGNRFNGKNEMQRCKKEEYQNKHIV